jgi:ABC-type sugar transport system permease subunit
MLWREIKANRVAYVYIAPFFILFAIFTVCFRSSAPDTSAFSAGTAWARDEMEGIDNYIRIFTDPTFLLAIKNTLVIGVIAHIPILFGGLVLAYILNWQNSSNFKTCSRRSNFLPMVTSAGGPSPSYSRCCSATTSA